MIRAERPFVIIGGISGENATEAMTTAGSALGDLLPGLTDGETNIRRFWVLATAERVWRQHPDLTMTHRPRGIPGMPDWVPDGYGDLPKFAPRPGVTSIDVPTLVYPQEAAEGYGVFRKLRADGVLPRDGLRFQVSLPFPEDACRLFATDPGHADLLIDAYLRAMRSDVAQICAAIPHDDLLLQWDVNWETIAIDYGDYLADLPPMDYRLHGDPGERFQSYLAELSADIPADVPLGMHLCYGDLHSRHFLEPKDLVTPVRMTNDAVRFAGHTLDYVQMPVPVEVDDDDFFTALSDFPADETTLYLGLLHPADGLAGAKARLDLARRHYSGRAGVATECGLGRRPPSEDFGQLLALHRAVADAI